MSMIHAHVSDLRLALDLLDDMGQRFPVIRECRPLYSRVLNDLCAAYPGERSAIVSLALTLHRCDPRYTHATANNDHEFDLRGKVVNTPAAEFRRKSREALQAIEKARAERKANG